MEEFMRFRAVGEQMATTSSHPPPTASYFSQQPFRGNPAFGDAVDWFRNPTRNVLREQYQLEMEMEKDEIRCEIIAAEIMRRRAEARRMMDMDVMLAGAWRGHPNRSGIVGFQAVPFPRIPEPRARISEIEHSLEAMPRTIHSGAKRQAATLPEAGASELHAVDSKKAKAEWRCSLCQVGATNEHSFNQHLQGKKHRAKEALGRSAGRTGYNYAY